MFCGECGTQNPDTNQFCKNCGKPLKTTRPVQAPPPAYAPVYPAPAPQQAYTPPPAGYAPAYAPPEAVPPAAAGSAPAMTFASGAGILALLSVLIAAVSWFYYPYLCGIAAVAAGGFALYKSKNVNRKIAVIGALGLAVAVVSMLVDLFFYDLFPPKI